MVSPSSLSAAGTVVRAAPSEPEEAGADAGGAGERSGFFTWGTDSAPDAGGWAAGFFGAGALLRGWDATTARARAVSGWRAIAFLTAGRLAAFLPFADFGAGLLAGINGSYNQPQAREERAIIPADPGLYSALT